MRPSDHFQARKDGLSREVGCTGLPRNGVCIRADWKWKNLHNGRLQVLNRRQAHKRQSPSCKTPAFSNHTTRGRTHSSHNQKFVWLGDNEEVAKPNVQNICYSSVHLALQRESIWLAEFNGLKGNTSKLKDIRWNQRPKVKVEYCNWRSSCWECLHLWMRRCLRSIKLLLEGVEEQNYVSSSNEQ